MQAKDIMTTKVVSVSEDTPVHEIVKLLLKHRISGIPVIGAAGKVVGMVSEGDLLRPEGANHAGRRHAWWLDGLFSNRMLDEQKAHGRTAGAVMTPDVVTVDQNTPVNEIAALLEHRHIKRVPVLADGRLVGIVSRANLLHALANTIVQHHEPTAAEDRQIREKLVEILLERHDLDMVLINVTVNEGRVRLWGVVENAEQAATAENAAMTLPGVKSVENYLGLGAMSGIPV